MSKPKRKTIHAPNQSVLFFWIHQPPESPERESIRRNRDEPPQGDPLGDPYLAPMAGILGTLAFLLGVGAAFVIAKDDNLILGLFLSSLGLLVAMTQLATIVALYRTQSADLKVPGPWIGIGPAQMLGLFTCLIGLTTSLTIGHLQGFHSPINEADLPDRPRIAGPILSEIGKPVVVGDLQIMLVSIRLLDAPRRRITILVEFSNVSRTAKINNSEIDLIGTDFQDEHSNDYLLLRTESDSLPDWEVGNSLYPGERRTRKYIFEPPIDQAQRLFFKVHLAPTTAAHKFVHFLIPRSKLVDQNPPTTVAPTTQPSMRAALEADMDRSATDVPPPLKAVVPR